MKVLVMAVPWLPQRTKRAVELAAQSGGEIVWDREHHAMHTWRLVLEAAGDDAVVIIEDDVSLTSNWREKVEAAVAEHPDSIIQFYSDRGADLDVGSRWEPGRTFLMNQCYYLPAGVASSLLAFTEDWAQRTPEHPTGYDIAMAKWMAANKQRYWLHVPSLVQHEPWTSEINPKRPRNRQSRTFTP